MAASLVVAVAAGGPALAQKSSTSFSKWVETFRKRAYARGKEFSDGPVVTEEARRFLFGQDASTVRDRS